MLHNQRGVASRSRHRFHVKGPAEPRRQRGRRVRCWHRRRWLSTSSKRLRERPTRRRTHARERPSRREILSKFEELHLLRQSLQSSIVERRVRIEIKQEFVLAWNQLDVSALRWFLALRKWSRPHRRELRTIEEYRVRCVEFSIEERAVESYAMTHARVAFITPPRRNSQHDCARARRKSPSHRRPCAQRAARFVAPHKRAERRRIEIRKFNECALHALQRLHFTECSLKTSLIQPKSLVMMSAECGQHLCADFKNPRFAALF